MQKKNVTMWIVNLWADKLYSFHCRALKRALRETRKFSRSFECKSHHVASTLLASFPRSSKHPEFSFSMLEQSHRTCSIRLRDSREASRKIWRRVGWHRRPTDENTTECHVDFDSELDSDAQEIVRICIFLFFATSRSRRCLSSLVFVLCENWKRIQSKSSR